MIIIIIINECKCFVIKLAYQEKMLYKTQIIKYHTFLSLHKFGSTNDKQKTINVYTDKKFVVTWRNISFGVTNVVFP